MIKRINKTGAVTARLPKPCAYCGGLGHLAFGCTKKPRKTLRAGKPIRSQGRVGRKLASQRQIYLRAFPAPHYCYYCLYIGIEQELDEKNIQIEHFLTKNHRPDLRFDWSNLVKSCPGHNKLKGNMDGPEFLLVLDQIRSS